MTIEEVKANVVGSWVGDVSSSNNSTRVKDAFTVSYKADGTGTLTLNKKVLVIPLLSERPTTSPILS